MSKRMLGIGMLLALVLGLLLAFSAFASDDGNGDQPTPEPTALPEPTPEPGKANVSVETSWCRDDHKPLRKVIVSIDPAGGASVAVDSNDVFTGSGGQVFLDEGDHHWSATASQGYELAGPSSGTIKVKSCADQPSEHPSTGGGPEPITLALAAMVGVGLLGAGAHILSKRRA